MRSLSAFYKLCLSIATLMVLAITLRVALPLSGYAQDSERPVNSFKGVKFIKCKHLFDITETGGKKLNQPSAVKVYQDKVYILDGVNSRVAVFDRQGKPLFEFGHPGSDPGGFKLPLGLDIDDQGRILVADSGNHRIQIFDSHSGLLNSFTLKEDRYGFPADPTDVVMDKENNRLIIVDNDNHRLLFYTPEGRFIKELGEVGFEDGQFRYPYSAALDKEANFFVVDVLNTRVQVFNADGAFIRNIGEWGIEKGQFFRPQGIAIDNQERVFVTENYEKIGVIQAFAKDGKFLALLGDPSRKKIHFSVPTDLCFDGKGRVYVCEMYVSRISVFEILE